jgi:hypothetical protein
MLSSICENQRICGRPSLITGVYAQEQSNVLNEGSKDVSSHSAACGCAFGSG